MDDDLRGRDVLPLRDLEEYLLHDGYGVGESLVDALLVASEGLDLTDELIEVGDREIMGGPKAAVTFRGPLLGLVGVDVTALVGPRSGFVVKVSACDRKERVLHLPEGIRGVDREQRPDRAKRVASGQTGSRVPTAVRGVRVSVAALFCGEQVAERCVGDTLFGCGRKCIDGLEQGLDTAAEMQDVEGVFLGESGLPRTCTGDTLGEPEHVGCRIHQTTDPGDDLCSCGDVDEVLLTVPHDADVLRDEVIVGPLDLIVEVCEEVRQIVVPAVPCIFDKGSVETHGIREVGTFGYVYVGEHVPCPGYPGLRGSSADGLRGVCDSCRTAHLLDSTTAECAPDVGSTFLHDLSIGLREPFAPAERVRVPGVRLHELHGSGEVMKLGDDSGRVHELEEAADCNRNLAAVSVELGLLRSDLGHPAVHGTEEPCQVPGLDRHAVRGASAADTVHEVGEPGAYTGTTEPGDESLGDNVLRTSPVEGWVYRQPHAVAEAYVGVVIGDAIRIDDRGQPEYVHQTGLLLLAGGPRREQLGSDCVTVDGVLDVGAGRLKHEHAGEVVVEAEGRPEKRTRGLGVDTGDPLAIHQVLVPDGPYVPREQTSVPGLRLRDEVGV